MRGGPESDAFSRAQERLLARDWRAAAALLIEFLRARPQSAIAAYNLAACGVNTGARGQARLFSRALAVAPLLTDGYSALARISGDPHKMLIGVLRQRPADLDALRRLTKVRDDLREACVLRVLALDPAGSADACHHVLGQIAREVGDLRRSARHFDRATRLRRAPGAPYVAPDHTWCAAHKLRHDIAQYRHLGLHREAEALERLRVEPEESGAVVFDLGPDRSAQVGKVYNRLHKVTPSGWDGRPALGGFDAGAASARYLAGEPNLAVIDGFLVPEAVEALGRFLRGSTIWFAMKGAGYVGAYMRDGLTDPLLVQIAEELPRRMPEVFAGQRFRTFWAYSYDQTMDGINPHADFAGVNVNFWIAPDEANLDPDSGGLVVYPKPAPLDWTFDAYNRAPAARIYEFLGPDRQRGVRVPHRRNRAVMFNSRLFHETDKMRFAPGFTNRRINITLLYGSPR